MKSLKVKGLMQILNIKYKISDIKGDDFILEKVATGARQGVVTQLLQHILHMHTATPVIVSEGVAWMIIS